MSDHSTHKAGTNTTSQMQFISLMDLFNMVRQRWVPGAGLGVLFAVAFAMFFMSQPAQYEAEASMVVELNAENIVNVAEVVESGVQNSNLLETAMNTHMERLKSRSMAAAVVGSLELGTDRRLVEGVTGPLDEGEPLPDPIALLIEEVISVSWLPDSQVIRVKVQHTDAALAQLLADRYVDLYIRLQLELRNQSTGDAVDFLDEQAIALRNRLETEERALQDYREAHDLVTVEQDQRILTERLSDLSAAITDARVRELRIESKLEQIDLAGEDLDLLMNIPFIGGRESVSKIYVAFEELQQNEKVLSETYFERHPKMVDNLASLTAVEASLWRAIEQGRQDFGVELLTVQSELTSLDAKKHETEQEARRLEKLSIEYRTLASKVESQRQLFDMVTARHNETSITQQMTLTSLRILDHANLPKKPVSPDIKKVGLAAVMLFGMVFVGLPLGMEFLDNRLRTFADIERFVGKPVIGDLPELKGESELEIAQEAKQVDHAMAERFRGIHGYIRLTLGEFPKPFSLVVTSSVPAEGKSIVASNMGYVFAAHQMKTILVDCDLRRPSVHRYKEMGNSNGIIEWVRSGQPLADQLLEDENLGIQKVEDAGELYVLTSGGSTRQASEILGDARIDLLVSRLKQEFDVILFDTPPVGVFHDATLVAGYADHTIFVARQNVTTRQKTRHSVGLMDRSEAPVLGVVFNGVKNSAAASGYGGYGSYNSSGYGYQYGYSKDADKYKKYYEQQDR